jgi:hypothetical protein
VVDEEVGKADDGLSGDLVIDGVEGLEEGLRQACATFRGMKGRAYTL